MINQFFHTDDGWAGLILRVGLGCVMFPHGAQKLLGWFGGPGFSATLAAFTAKMGIPAPVALLVIAAESFGAVALVFGFFTRLASFGILCNMVGAILLVHLPNGFFMNWFGQQKGEGVEYHLLAVSIACALLVVGGGKWSMDREVEKMLAR